MAVLIVIVGAAVEEDAAGAQHVAVTAGRE
jgi:hypothetical protein